MDIQQYPFHRTGNKPYARGWPKDDGNGMSGKRQNKGSRQKID
jgi:hypothetical protein